MWFHLFYVVYSFSSCWVKFIFVKNLLLYRVSTTSLTTDHPSSVSLLEESMIIFFFSDYRCFPSSSKEELFLFARNKKYYMTQYETLQPHIEGMFPQIWKITCVSKSIDNEKCQLCYSEHLCCVSQKVHVHSRSLPPALSTDMSCNDCNNKVTKWSWLLQRWLYFHSRNKKIETYKCQWMEM